MRRLLPCVIGMSAAACLGSGEGPVTENPLSGTVPKYTVVGTVFDSLASLRANAGVPNAAVSVGGKPTVTDAAGQFAVSLVDSGMIAIRVEIPDYEPRTQMFLNDGSRSAAVPLRRYAPLVTGFLVAGDSAMTTVVDLQGRKSMDRWTESRATVQTGGGATLTILGQQMVWQPIDDFTWTVVLHAPGLIALDWSLEDVTGFRFVTQCQAPDRCEHLPHGGDPN